MEPILGRIEDPIVEITFGRAGFVQYLMGLCLGLISRKAVGPIWINLDPTKIILNY
jgi:hypothetical protein